MEEPSSSGYDLQMELVTIVVGVGGVVRRP